MFGLDPFTLLTASIQILLLLALAAGIGWFLGRVLLAGRTRKLQTAIDKKQAELDDCRWIKKAGRLAATASAKPVPIAQTPPAFVHADPLLPAINPDNTPELIDADGIPPVTIAPIADEPPLVTAPFSTASNGPTEVRETSAVTGDSEAAVLSRIATRAHEINFDRIGRATAAEADDLKDIVGVGPFLERKLHALGIYTFRQVANFTKEDIDKVNAIIEFFPGRIERDNWVDQSKGFHNKKYGAND